MADELRLDYSRSIVEQNMADELGLDYNRPTVGQKMPDGIPSVVFVWGERLMTNASVDLDC